LDLLQCDYAMTNYYQRQKPDGSRSETRQGEQKTAQIQRRHLKSEKKLTKVKQENREVCPYRYKYVHHYHPDNRKFCHTFSSHQYNHHLCI
jgi:hypothetical protein